MDAGRERAIIYEAYLTALERGYHEKIRVVGILLLLAAFIFIAGTSDADAEVVVYDAEGH